MKRDSLQFIDSASDDFTGTKSPNDGIFSLGDRPDLPGDFTDGEDSHDGAPGGRVLPSEVHGTGEDDHIFHVYVDEAQKLYGFAGNDTIESGAGNDSVFGGLGNDVIIANGGDDVIVGGEGDDNLYGEAGNDSIHTGDGADIVFGGTGDDFIYLTDDGDVDTVYFIQGNGNDVIDNFETGIDQVGISGFGFTSFADIEALITYSGDQALIDLGNGDTIIFTGLEAPLAADDFIF
ncbi:Serralysin B precursor [Roseovarius sp. THAF9]|uniref:calcium-binding protein n=1 Tax=Roseovarius sp. THAF9 TaxID=2587847 RepID=UPI0012682D11|nr:hypothetical protein [Roseovarius sp. THAF9]QFT91370.1 Serralysin B precursor [Roseovarius sp. THAF9]